MREEGLLVRRERKRSADAFTVATVAVMFLAVAVPWFVQAVDVNIVPTAWCAFLMSAAYVALAIIIDRWGNPRAVTVALYAAPFLAVVMGTVVWHFAGGIAQPALLMIFSLAVLGSAFVPPRWVPYTVAAAAVIAVTFTSILEAPSLGWYITQSGIPVDWLIRWIPGPAPGVEALAVAPAQLFATLQAFALGMFALAVCATRIIRFREREVEVRVAVESPQHADALLSDALRAAPIPLLVVTGTAQIVTASDSFHRQMLVQTRSARGLELFDIVAFEDRQRVLSLLNSGGHIDFARYRVGEEERIASVEAERFHHGTEDYCCLTIRDWNELGYLALAANAVDRPLLLVGTEDQRLRYANRAAAKVLGDLYVGRDMSWLEEGTRIPLRLSDSEPATLVALEPR
jgi:PAS domain-containing protein